MDTLVCKINAEIVEARQLILNVSINLENAVALKYIEKSCI